MVSLKAQSSGDSQFNLVARPPAFFHLHHPQPRVGAGVLQYIVENGGATCYDLG